MPKLYVEVRSGLGNQLFQFAFGYLLSERTSRQLVTCPSYFDNFWKFHAKKLLGREYRSFRLPLTIGQKLSIASPKAMRSLMAEGHITTLDEGHHDVLHVESAVEGDGDIFLRGYWQIPEYLAPHLQKLRDTIKPQFQLSLKAKTLLDSLRDHYVAVHVRRGDFMTNRAFGACTIDYYNQAMDYLSTRIQSPVFVVFTNDREWVSRNFDRKFNYLIYDNRHFSNSDIEELYLMSTFNALIISNSTFSWWSAFLNRNQLPMILCPSKWFLKDELQAAARRFIQPGWTSVDNLLELHAKL